MKNFKFNSIRLYQLADSTLPTGGFVFSSGLESMARLGWLKNSDDMYNYLKIQLEQACTAELPFINSIISNYNSTKELKNIFSYYDAFIQIEEIRSASIRQAKSWIDILSEIEENIKNYCSFIFDYNLTLHYTPVFALSLFNISIDLNTIKELYIYIILRDQISAAIRLGLTGPNKGASILSYMLNLSSEHIIKYSDLCYTQAFRAAPMLEIAQAKHKELYTKLFQN